MHRRNGYDLTFDQALAKLDYTERGMYFKYLQNLYNYFNKNQIHIVFIDELNKDKISLKTPDGISDSGFKDKDSSTNTKVIMNSIFKFLNVKPMELDYEYVFLNKYIHTKPNERIQSLVKSLYKDDTEKFFNLIGKRVDS